MAITQGEHLEGDIINSVTTSSSAYMWWGLLMEVRLLPFPPWSGFYSDFPVQTYSCIRHSVFNISIRESISYVISPYCQFPECSLCIRQSLWWHTANIALLKCPSNSCSCFIAQMWVSWCPMAWWYCIISSLSLICFSRVHLVAVVKGRSVREVFEFNSWHTLRFQICQYERNLMMNTPTYRCFRPPQLPPTSPTHHSSHPTQLPATHT